MSDTTSLNSRILKRPQTTEGATARYLQCYEKQYTGSDREEMARLKDLSHAKIILLRTKAPKFYEEKLYNLINQAASALLTCNVGLPEGVKKFHETHEYFLKILDELGRCQPSGQVDFQIELDRLKEHSRLIAEHARLSHEVSLLDAREVDLDELSDSEDGIKAYTKKMDEIDKKRKELKNCAILLAKIEGEEIDESAELELVPRSGSVLERLELNKIVFLEEKLKSLGENVKNKRTAVYEQRPFIEDIIKQLQLDGREFSAQDLKSLAQDIYDSYLDFYRRLEDEKRNAWHDHMLNNELLRPKEGAILESPDDITPEMAAKMEESRAKRLRGLYDLKAKYESQELNLEEEERFIKETGDDALSDEDDEGEWESSEVLEIINKKKELFARVKEEPRDDYEDYQYSNLEDVVEEEEEQVLQSNGESGYADDSINDEESGRGSQEPGQDCHEPGQNSKESDPSAQALKNLASILDSDDDDDDANSNKIQSDASRNSRHLRNGANSHPVQEGVLAEETTGNEVKDEDDNICLGLVAPKDKIEYIEVSDDE